MTRIIYLHGFASSPRSTKAQALSDRLQQHQHTCWVPDLNQGDFTHLTLSRQIQQVRSLLPQDGSEVMLIGSSFGGLTSAWLGELCPQVTRLVLMAPAFDFLAHWLPKLGKAQVQQWQETSYLPVYHYAVERSLPLHYDFVRDLETYDLAQLQRPVPTWIIHGTQDDVIPIQSSRDYVASRSWVTLQEVESDHLLTEVLPDIWQAIAQFLQLSSCF